ncbi:MAG: MFS transporter [Hyphomicrobiaceae bacterium]
MTRDRIHFLFLNVGHFLDHLFMLIFATVAALKLRHDWNMSYAELIPYATPGFIAFGLFSLPAGWLADKWSREGMMAVFFLGIGAASVGTALASTPLEIAFWLFLVGAFGAIYHPVGIAMVIRDGAQNGMRLAVNGVWGNLGVGSAALVTGFLIDHVGWRSAFALPGLVSVALGLAYVAFLRSEPAHERTARKAAPGGGGAAVENLGNRSLFYVSAVIFFTTMVGSLIFQSTTFALPKIFEERLGSLGTSATTVGTYAFLVFALASMAQLVVGYLVDRHAVRTVFAGLAVLQIVFFLLMPGLIGVPALIVALAFMLAVFGQIPLNDFLIGRLSKSEFRARALAARFVVAFTAIGLAVPILSWIHANWGFDRLFHVMAIGAALILAAVVTLPRFAPRTHVQPAPAE